MKKNFFNIFKTKSSRAVTIENKRKKKEKTKEQLKQKELKKQQDDIDVQDGLSEENDAFSSDIHLDQLDIEEQQRKEKESRELDERIRVRKEKDKKRKEEEEEQLEAYKQKKAEKAAEKRQKLDNIREAILNPNIRNKIVTWENKKGHVDNIYEGYYNDVLLFSIKRGALSFRLTVDNEELLREINRKENRRPVVIKNEVMESEELKNDAQSKFTENNSMQSKYTKNNSADNIDAHSKPKKAPKPIPYSKTAMDIYKLQVVAEKLIKDNVELLERLMKEKK